MADRYRHRIVEDFTHAFIRDGSSTYIRNLQTEVGVQRWGDHLLPITINHGEKAATFVCSPWVGYVDYTREELSRFPNRALVPALHAVVSGVAGILRLADLDRIVHINNWMMSTNLLAAIDAGLVAEQTEEFTARFPCHILAMRSLNWRQNSRLMVALQAAGWVLLPSRQLFLVDDIASQMTRRRDLKRDEALWRNTPYRYEELQTISRPDAQRIAALYAMLYLDKYSRLNPIYTPDFVIMTHAIGMIRYMVLRDADGVIQSFGGIHHFADYATMPLMGYNTGIDQREGLYRLGFHAGSRFAADNNLAFNMSSGASSFKLARGATAEMEFSAFHVRHLPAKRRVPIDLLQVVARRIGMPILQRYKL
ncbi:MULTISPECIES: hypothetical protein [Rhizobium]|uniref:GNAT family N-acetyltransferase n=1 Tax=Rhizobium rhododendri TaxID=2506430 RepID=A0ABY8IQT4_9HYPH|nr:MULTISPECIES: hypothetical protein [Rhizobium]TQX85174.1 hypothetical protein EQW76_22375 [Rhizobium sp. rho-13.1]TQY09462.1 hypothetical protein EQW74_21580 [Rhizobium sp. rho-1.1]WFS25944.1 hypothetical protein PR018_20735 [Rhizobium rhododendri]